jgi:cytidylate kinase
VIFLAIITISRQLGSFGSEAAELLAKQLGMRLILKDTVLNEWMADVVNDHQLRMLTESPKFYLNIMHDGITYKEYIERKLMDEASRQPSIIVGMGSQLIFRDHPGAVRVRIVASDNTRTERIRRKYGFGVKEAEQMIQQSDKKHKRYISTLYGVDWAETFNYDMVLNTDGLTAEQCADMIALLAESKDRAGASGALADAYEHFPAQEKRNITFKHPAEEEFANILDMYGIEWQYEPRTFPVQWDAEGNVKMAFSPDFYLVRFDTYIEITTMDQKYVTTKNKKVKRLRELYPGININIVYKKDFNSLLKRFGFGGGDVIDEFNRSERNSVQRGNDKDQGEGAWEADK